MCSNCDEFRIEAFRDGKVDRVWARDSLETAKFIAEQAVDKLGYDCAEVRNTFGGHISDVLFEYSPISGAI